MHASRWLLGISAIALVAAGGFAAGCSSSTSAPPTSEDAGMDSGGSPEDSAASCHVDASLTTFAASDAAGAGCAACVQTMCASAIQGCSSSCTCISLFSCLADAGVTASTLTSNPASLAMCVPGGISSAATLLMDPGIMGITTCLSDTCSNECAGLLPTMEAGTTTDGGGGTPEAGGSTDSGSD